MADTPWASQAGQPRAPTIATAVELESLEQYLQRRDAIVDEALRTSVPQSIARINEPESRNPAINLPLLADFRSLSELRGQHRDHRERRQQGTAMAPTRAWAHHAHPHLGEA